jgi:F-type H+-transporting ATPase subunit b
MHLDLWTIGLQAVNVLVLVWLLSRFLFRPVAGIIAARRQAADAMLAEADAARAKAAAEANGLAQQRQGLADEKERMLAAVREDAQGERDAILRQVNEAAAKLRAAAEEAIERERKAAQGALHSDAAKLALTIAERLSERLPARVLNAAFLEGLAAVLPARPAAATPMPIEVRSAAPLDDTSRAACRTMVTSWLGAAPEITFRTDTSLIAGIELAMSGLVIRNNWRADLDRIARALHDEADHDTALQPVA